MTSMRTGIAIVGVLAVAAPAVADPVVHATAEAEVPSRHLVYGELLGKGGAYGLGYELTLSRRLAIGGAGSFAVIRDQQVLTLAPYVHATIMRGAKHALFAELGAQLVHSRIPSPVEDWDGMAETGGGGFASLGWERGTEHLVLRASGSVVVGEGGVAPWLGLAVGFRP